MNGILIAMSFTVTIAFFVVLFLFLASFTRLLRSAAERLEATASVTHGIREHCEVISPAIGGMNQNLYIVGAHLFAVGDLSEGLAQR